MIGVEDNSEEALQEIKTQFEAIKAPSAENPVKRSATVTFSPTTSEHR